MVIQVLEGTWEEIRARDEELVGHRVRLEILADEVNENSIHDVAASTSGTQTLAEMRAGKTGNVRFEPDNLSENVKEVFGKIVAEKHRREVDPS